MFIVAVANSVLTINCIIMDLFGPSITYINKWWQAFKNCRFVIEYRNVSYTRNETR
jgi:hypothetical protein